MPTVCTAPMNPKRTIDSILRSWSSISLLRRISANSSGVAIRLYVVINSYYDRVKFTLPEFVGGDQWMMFIETSDPERSTTSTLKTGDKYEVTGRSLLLLAALTSGEPVKVISRLALDELLREDVRPHEGHRAGEIHQKSNIETTIQ